MITEDLNDQDDYCWQSALGKETIAGYLRYLKLMPQGRHVEEANLKITALYKVIDQEIDSEWETALAANSYYKVLEFTIHYPDSKFAPEYASKLKESEHFKLIEDEVIRRKESSALTKDTMFFYIPVSRLVIMSILTNNLYVAYWMYKNWKVIKNYEKSDILPFWRGVFGVFFIYNLFEIIPYNYESKSSHKANFSTNLAIVWIVLALLGTLVSKSSEWLDIPSLQYLGMLITFFNFMFFIPVQKYINTVNEMIEPRPMYNKWSIGHFVCLLLGLATWAFIIYGILEK